MSHHHHHHHRHHHHHHYHGTTSAPPPLPPRVYKHSGWQHVVVNALVSINVSYSMPGPLSTWMGKSSQYVTSHPGQLNLAIPALVGTMSTSESWGESWGVHHTPHDTLALYLWSHSLSWCLAES